MDHQTTILIREATRERLKETGKKGETYDDLINQLLDYTKPTSFKNVERGTPF